MVKKFLLLVVIGFGALQASDFDNAMALSQGDKEKGIHLLQASMQGTFFKGEVHSRTPMESGPLFPGGNESGLYYLPGTTAKTIFKAALRVHEVPVHPLMVKVAVAHNLLSVHQGENIINSFKPKLQRLLETLCDSAETSDCLGVLTGDDKLMLQMIRYNNFLRKPQRNHAVQSWATFLADFSATMKKTAEESHKG